MYTIRKINKQTDNNINCNIYEDDIHLVWKLENNKNQVSV